MKHLPVEWVIKRQRWRRFQEQGSPVCCDGEGRSLKRRPAWAQCLHQAHSSILCANNNRHHASRWSLYKWHRALISITPERCSDLHKTRLAHQGSNSRFSASVRTPLSNSSFHIYHISREISTGVYNFLIQVYAICMGLLVISKNTAVSHQRRNYEDSVLWFISTTVKVFLLCFYTISRGIFFHIQFFGGRG